MSHLEEFGMVFLTLSIHFLCKVSLGQKLEWLFKDVFDKNRNGKNPSIQI
jgi:hypothetical protein